MIPTQPVCLWDYIDSKKRKLHPSLSSRFYLSWEDGLWDIVRSYSLPKGSLVLIPNFWCEDVVKNMKAHGLIIRYYEVDENFQPNEKLLLNEINELKPKIVVLFDAVGIANNSLRPSFISQLPDELIIIEDAVHKIINIETLSITRERYFCMNSLRKVVPLQGSFVIGKPDSITVLKGADRNTYLYSLYVIILWSMMQGALLLQKYSPGFYVKKICGRIAEKLMKRGYDLIGDSKSPGYCPKFFENKSTHITVDKIYNVKKEQVKIYDEYFSKINNEYVSIPKFTEKDSGNLRGYPVIIQKSFANTFIMKLRDRGLYVQSELEGCPWTKKRSVIYLPLGPYLDTQEIRSVTTLFESVL